MVLTVTNPDGMVMATSAPGVSRAVSLWDAYVLMFTPLEPCGLIAAVRGLASRWEQRPPLGEFMSHLKKLLIDSHIQVIGFVGGLGEDGRPALYRILGQDLRRVNLNPDGSLRHDIFCVERTPLLGRLITDVQVANGDEWDRHPGLLCGCDRFTMAMAVEMARTMLRFSHEMAAPGSTPADFDSYAQMAVIDTDGTVTLKTPELKL